MVSPMRRALIAAVVPLLLVPAELPCFAARCSCVPRPTDPAGIRADVANKLAAATAVFVGTVQRVAMDSTQREFADFRVTTAWKGVADTIVRIRLQAVAGIRSSCELSMQAGQQWLIFATERSDSALHTGYCTLSAPVAGAEGTLAVLGPGRRTASVQTVTTPSGLIYRVLAPGAGPAAQPGQQVSIHETTSLQSGAVLYTSRGGRPIPFLLGGGQVIAGVTPIRRFRLTSS
jgi:hypothetical protein